MSITIYTGAGKAVDLLDLPPAAIDLGEICTCLSRICRYSGRTPVFYSVAEHSLNLARYFQANDKWQHPQIVILRTMALLHDASEAYIGDLCGPVKHTLCPRLEELEDILFRRILSALTDVKPGAGDYARLRKTHALVMRAEFSGFFCGVESAANYADLVHNESMGAVALRLFRALVNLGVREHG